MRLSQARLAHVPTAIARPGYDRMHVRAGVVHFGPGAFHRAHQAPVFDSLLADDPRWGVTGVSLHSTSVADALLPQDGLYTLALLDAEPDMRVIGAIGQVLTARDPAAIVDAVASADTRIVSATITEKGYCLASDGSLDFAHPAIAHDLLQPETPTSFIGWLVVGLIERRRRGGGGLTVLSCDNLADNGRKLGAAVRAFAEARDSETARWIADEVRFPCSMVDSITPATDDALRDRVRAAIGMEDAWPIQRERFSQWVIEPDFAGDRPPLDHVGATFSTDVRGYEMAKLRLLNGAHSTLAYMGLERRHETVAQAMRDGALAAFVERLMRDDIAPSLAPPAGLDVATYIDAILQRFANPAMEHRLAQIAWDGSQKLPYRLLDAVCAARAAGRPIERLAMPVAAWLRFIEAKARSGEPLTDPLAERLLAASPDTILAMPEIFGELAGDSTFAKAVIGAMPL
ncbi:mannitol dehydrogenase family protein [Sphingomonas sp.]